VKRVISAEIPLIQAAGSHYQVGEQIGAAMRDRIHRMIRELSHHLPATRTWQQLLEMGAVFQAFSRSAYPQYMEELQGMADAAAVSFGELFLLLCEELWERPLWGQVQAGDEPEFLGVSVGGVGYSAGFNAAGISLTGNELSSNDVRPGVPRLLVVRAILAARRLGEAMDACLLPQRASSYNNIIADSYGEVYSMEGSATDCEAVYIDGDTLAHANHYAAPPMRRFEADRNEIGGSIIRHNRAMRLLREHYGHLSPERFRLLLADHANYPASICKHEGESVTAFSIIIDLSTLRAWIGHGRPCQTAYREFSLAPWTPPAGWPRPPHLPVK
jgi:hypothetical protein